MGLVESLEGKALAVPCFMLYTITGFLPQGTQLKVFERLPGSWPGKVPDYHQLKAYIDPGANALASKLVPESLEQRLASENKKLAFGAALNYTTISAAIEFIVGTGIVIPAAVAGSYDLATLGGIALLGDAGFRLLIPNGPAGLGEGLVEFGRTGVYGVRAAFDRKHPSNS